MPPNNAYLTQLSSALRVVEKRGWDIVPIWVERFALTVSAAAFFGLVVLNNLNVDWIQRTGLGMGILGLTVFLAQTVHVRNKVKAMSDTLQQDQHKNLEVRQSSQGSNSPNITGNNNTVTVNSSDPTVLRKLDAIEKLLKAQGGEDKLLKKYPLGYVVFDVDFVTNAVTPLEARKGLEAYQYDFRPVRITQNTADRIAIRLPDLIKDKKLVLTGGETGGWKRVGNLGGYLAEDKNGVGVQVWGEILTIKGSEVTFLVGFDKAPKLP